MTEEIKKKKQAEVEVTLTKGQQFIQTSKGVYPLSALRKYEIKKTSKQIKEEEQFGINELVAPPNSPNSLLQLYDMNSTFSACVDQIAEDVAGLGWRLELKEGQEEDENEKKKINELLEKPNPEESLRQIMKEMLIDVGIIGWGGFEVVRNAIREVAEIWHIAGHTFRIHKKKKKFCQERNNDKVWFKRYGEEKDISAEAGKQGKFEEKSRANELIYYKRYYPRSDYYGAPPILSAVGSLIGLIGIRDYNLSFFENYGIPAALITLIGDWKDGSAKKIKDFLDTEVKGSENAHRTMVFQVPDENAKFQWQQLSVDIKEGSFRLYRESLVEDILIAYHMPGERIGVRPRTGKLGGGKETEEGTKIYVESVVEPYQTDMENIVNSKIIEEGLNCHKYIFKLNTLDIRNIDAEGNRYIKYIEHAMMTPNQARNRLGLGKTYVGGDKYYMKSGMEEVGEEELEKREDRFIKAIEDLQKGINKLAEDDFLKVAGEDKEELRD